MKYLFIILVFTASCKQESSQVAFAKSVYSKLKNENLEKLAKVEFGTRGDVEMWSYSLTQDSDYVWLYYPQKDSFDLNTNPHFEKFKLEVGDPLSYVKSLEAKKNKLDIKGISRSPWPEYFTKFWLNNSEVLIYLPDGLIIDSDAKHRWLNEFNSGVKLNKEWAYLDLTDQ